MPIQGDNYVAPEWKNGQPPAINAQELNDMSRAIEDGVYASQTSDSDDGTVAYLLKNGQNILARTVAEAVKTSDVWGGNLDSTLQKLEQAILYNQETGVFGNVDGTVISIPKIEAGSYVGNGNNGPMNPTVITFSGPPKAVICISSMYSALEADIGFCWVGQPGGSGSDNYPVFSSNANSLSLYSNGQARWQANATGVRYCYVGLVAAN